MPQRSDSRLRNSFLSIIAMMQHKAKDKGLEPTLTIAKLTDLLKVAGITVSYQQIVNLTKDPIIAGSVKDINKNQITLNSDIETPEEDLPIEQAPLGDEPAAPLPPENNMEQPPAFGGEQQPPQPMYGEQQPNQHVSQSGPNIVSQMARRAASR